MLELALTARLDEREQRDVAAKVPLFDGAVALVPCELRLRVDGGAAERAVRAPRRPATDRRGACGGPRRPVQAAAVAMWCLWSLERLCVAMIRRHSVRTAALPRR